MPKELIMPALGVAQDTGKVLRWLRSEGDEVRQGEPLLEVETDKANVEVEAPASGVLARVLAREGDEVPVGQVIGWLLLPGEEPSALLTEPTVPPAGEETPPPQHPAREAPQETPARPRASPKARRLAREMGWT